MGISEDIMQTDQCLKIWDYQWNPNVGCNDGMCPGVIPNKVCFWRLIALMVITWISIWILFVWWRFRALVAMKEVITIEREVMEAEGAGFGGGAGIAPVANHASLLG